jgi:hypothetical protein
MADIRQISIALSRWDGQPAGLGFRPHVRRIVGLLGGYVLGDALGPLDDSSLALDFADDDIGQGHDREFLGHGAGSDGHGDAPDLADTDAYQSRHHRCDCGADPFSLAGHHPHPIPGEHTDAPGDDTELVVGEVDHHGPRCRTDKATCESTNEPGYGFHGDSVPDSRPKCSEGGYSVGASFSVLSPVTR